MINVNSVKILTELIFNKEQNGQISLTRFNEALNSSVLWFFNDCYGQPTQSKGSNSANNMFWQSGKKISDNLRHLIKIIDLPVNAKGEAKRPTDFIHSSTIRYVHKEKVWNDPCNKKLGFKIITKEVGVAEIRDSEVSERLDSELLTPTLEYPIAVIYNNYIQIYPINAGMLKFTYLKKPNTPFWAYTTVNSRPVYDHINSVDIEFPEECINEIVMRVCSLMGINISNNLLLQYTNQMKQQGV
jgi:hypothetical protein